MQNVWNGVKWNRAGCCCAFMIAASADSGFDARGPKRLQDRNPPTTKRSTCVIRGYRTALYTLYTYRCVRRMSFVFVFRRITYASGRTTHTRAVILCVMLSVGVQHLSVSTFLRAQTSGLRNARRQMSRDPHRYETHHHVLYYNDTSDSVLIKTLYVAKTFCHQLTVGYDERVGHTCYIIYYLRVFFFFFPSETRNVLHRGDVCFFSVYVILTTRGVLRSSPS